MCHFLGIFGPLFKTTTRLIRSIKIGHWFEPSTANDSICYQGGKLQCYLLIARATKFPSCYNTNNWKAMLHATDGVDPISLMTTWFEMLKQHQFTQISMMNSVVPPASSTRLNRQVLIANPTSALSMLKCIACHHHNSLRFSIVHQQLLRHWLRHHKIITYRKSSVQCWVEFKL